MLHNDLEKIKRYPFHMPGHKRNTSFDIIGSEIDITEIDGFDNLHFAESSIKEIEDNLKELYNSLRSFILINGSTVGLLSAIFALTNRGDKIIIARNCHKSVYNACFLRELNVIYIEPDYDDTDGYYTSVSQDSVNNAIENNPDAKAIVITSPTYEGNISNIKCDIPLIVDCAHGAHFGFGSFPKYPKADIVISSLHKTLPCLTQTAVLNVYNEKYIGKVKMYLDIFETSSPSYVLMNSVSKCIELLKNNSGIFKEYENNLEEFYKIDLKNLKIKKTDDRGKIVISVAETNISGVALANILRIDYNIECEMASKNYVILMTSIADTTKAFKFLSEALLKIDKELSFNSLKTIKKLTIPIKSCKASEIEFSEKTSFKKSLDKVSAEYVYAYPPDIPIIVPGEIISKEIIEEILNMIKSGINIVSDSNLLPDCILTKRNK